MFMNEYEVRLVTEILSNVFIFDSVSKRDSYLAALHYLRFYGILP